MKFKKNASGIRFTKHLAKVQTPFEKLFEIFKELITKLIVKAVNSFFQARKFNQIWRKRFHHLTIERQIYKNLSI